MLNYIFHLLITFYSNLNLHHFAYRTSVRKKIEVDYIRFYIDNDSLFLFSFATRAPFGLFFSSLILCCAKYLFIFAEKKLNWLLKY